MTSFTFISSGEALNFGHSERLSSFRYSVNACRLGGRVSKEDLGLRGMSLWHTNTLTFFHNDLIFI